MSAPSHALFDLVQLVGGHGAGRGVMLVFVCYLDDSDAEQSAVVTMAGYAARIESWRIFEDEVEPIFQRYGVEILHAVDFHGNRGIYKNWSGVKKNTFVDEVYGVAVRHIPLALSRSMHKKNYKARQRELGINQSMSAYGVVFGTIVHAVARANSLSGEIQKDGVSFVVESGHNNNAEIEKYFHKNKSHEIFAGVLRTLSFSGKSESRAIQLADFFAFYSRREAARMAAAPSIITKRERIYLRISNIMQHHSIVGFDPYGAQVDDWRDGDFSGDTAHNRKMPSERPVTPKRRRGAR